MFIFRLILQKDVRMIGPLSDEQVVGLEAKYAAIQVAINEGRDLEGDRDRAEAILAMLDAAVALDRPNESGGDWLAPPIGHYDNLH